ncbi:transcriptional regulator [Hydrogenophaga sp. Root209]|uniref:IclR family transcriptional regulator n=1 Tax=Hydrogenophaga sp. Root209 TaxID=1736490 RepID=UPI0006FAD506|nr:helix-turn-helix domain-containing protein [Hydrogenophaga sp. Root209]KRB98781.1 transcriptional regulator [Hydrogenophaga sp. Root209]
MTCTPATVKSAARALELLEHFRAERVPRSRKDIADALGYPQSSTTALLKSLTVLGYLNYDRVQRVYFPTLRVAALGEWIGPTLLGDNEQLLEAMRDVHNATGETVSLGLLNDVYIQHVRIIQSTHAMRFYTEEGSMRPVVKSSLGWLLMSTRSPEQIERLVRRSNIVITQPSERVNVAEMVQRILSFKGQSQIYIEGMPFADGATMCALVPVTIHGQPVVLGLGGSLERVRANRVRYAAVLRRAVASIRP